MNFEIVSDSSCDLDSTIVRALNLTIVPFYFSFDGETYYKENVDYSTNTFFNRLINEDLQPKTSLPSVQDYYDTFENILKQGKDIICLCISSKLSGSYQSACNAKMNISDYYPDRRIEIVDSLAATGAQGVIVQFFARLRDENKSIDDTLRTFQDINKTYKIFFTVDSLDYLANGGRIGKASLLLGTLLDVKPILNLSDGEIFPVAKVRKKKKALDTIVNQSYEYSQLFDNFTITILTCVNTDDVKYLHSLCQKKFGKNIPINFSHIGATIGVHTGPTAVGLIISNY